MTTAHRCVVDGCQEFGTPMDFTCDAHAEREHEFIARAMAESQMRALAALDPGR